jgi:hypothetical protein
MTIRFDKEDDLFVIPTIVISKIDTKYVKTTNIHIAWLRYSLVFICQNSDTANTKNEKDEKIFTFTEIMSLHKEYHIHVRDLIAKKYMEQQGWKYAYHITSSENGERPGLTVFTFSNTELPEDDADRKNSHKVLN